MQPKRSPFWVFFLGFSLVCWRGVTEGTLKDYRFGEKLGGKKPLLLDLFPPLKTRFLLPGTGRWERRMFFLGAKKPSSFRFPRAGYETSWWLNQPIWKRFVKLDHFRRSWVKIENIRNHHLENDWINRNGSTRHVVSKRGWKKKTCFVCVCLENQTKICVKNRCHKHIWSN